jgi:hypothetical protein
MQEQVISAVNLPGKTARAQLAQHAVTQAVEELVRQLTAATAPQPSPEGQRPRRPYTVKQVSYLIPSCDGCGLAWSFFDPACVDGIRPHFTDQGAALEQLPRDYGWRVRSCRFGHPLMACRTCAAAGVIPAGGSGMAAGRSGLACGGWCCSAPPSVAARLRAGSSGISDRRTAAAGQGAPDGDRRRKLPRP